MHGNRWERSPDLSLSLPNFLTTRRRKSPRKSLAKWIGLSDDQGRMKRTELKRKTPLKRTGFRNKEKGKGLKRTPLKKVSRKRSTELSEYSRRKKEYFSALADQQGEENPACEVCAKRLATDWHHVLPLGRGGKLNQPDELMLAVCRTCHNKIHDNMKWTEEQGYLLKG